MTITRRAHPEEFEQITAFYRDNDYEPAVSPSDTFAVAETNGVLCGAVRLCEEHGVLLLRGMRVRVDMRRQGTGTRLLQTVEAIIGEGECFCIPLRYLRAFYGRVGFAEIEATDAPPFLRERCAEYKRLYDLDVIIMRRRGETKK
jgi:N-acetylglutamate synthase-like GNAT family acetyltransferase